MAKPCIANNLHANVVLVENGKQYYGCNGLPSRPYSAGSAVRQGTPMDYLASGGNQFVTVTDYSNRVQQPSSNLFNDQHRQQLTDTHHQQSEQHTFSITRSASSRPLSGLQASSAGSRLSNHMSLKSTPVIVQQQQMRPNIIDSAYQGNRFSMPPVQTNVVNSSAFNPLLLHGSSGISREIDVSGFISENVRRPQPLSVAQRFVNSPREVLLQLRPAPMYSARQPPIVQQQVYSKQLPRPVAMKAVEPAVISKDVSPQNLLPRKTFPNNVHQCDQVFIDKRTIFNELGLLKCPEENTAPLQALWTAIEQPTSGSKLHSPTSTDSDITDWKYINRQPPPYPRYKSDSSTVEDATASSEQAESVTDSGVGDALGQAEGFEPLSSELQDTLIYKGDIDDIEPDDSSIRTLVDNGEENDVNSNGGEKCICHSPKPQRKANAEERDRERRFTYVKHYPAEAFKFYMEQHYENLFRQQRQRDERKHKLEQEMHQVGMTDDTKPQLRLLLQQKESNYNRLRRVKLNKDMFLKIHTLGVGAFGEVALVQKKDSRQLFAMKVLRWNDVLRRNQIAHVKAERDILAEADNDWVVKLYWSFRDEDCLYFILEYIPGGDLMGLLIRLEIFSEELARFYIAELVLAIESVHKLGFIHRDIKPDNILIDKQGHIKLTDFGLCTGFRWTHSSQAYKKGWFLNQNAFVYVISYIFCCVHENKFFFVLLVLHSYFN